MSTERPTLFEGKYEVIGKIAEGGMGAVFKVRHRLLDEIRVIKVMRPQAAESEEQRKRFLREAQTATKLRHPNIVTFHDFGLDESGTAYMVMEFVDGVTLAHLIRRGGALPLPIALELAKQTLSALGYLHRRGIVHRDISPDNILMSRHEELGAQIKLIDLGIAKVIQSEEALTVGDAFLGKLRYCSPEQLAAGSATSTLDGRSDIFSFGIVLSELLTGVCPLPGESVQSIVAAHISGRLLTFEQTDPLGRVAPPLRELVEDALKADPATRIQTAEEFARRIDEVATRERVHADPHELRAFADQALAARPVVTLQVKPGDFPLSGSGAGSAARVAAPQPAEDLHSARTIIEKTERWDEQRHRQGEPARRSQPRAMALILAAAAVLAVIAGYTLFQRARPRPSAEAVPSTTASEPEAAAPAPTSAASPALSEPTALPAAAVPPAASEARAPAPTLVPEAESLRPTAAARRPGARPTHAAESIASASKLAPPGRQDSAPASSVAAAKTRYCATVEPTSYAQAAVKEKPKGFDAGGGEAFRGPRPDAARITIQVEVSPPSPMEGQPFRVVARLINGGDTSITLAKIEESAARARGGFQSVDGASAPATVQVGAAFTVYDAQGVLTEGNAYSKDVKVTDSVGDTWKTSVRIGVCPE
ncbi:MAG TPA: serine/threonine-protein kinase [Thermoanaerobaculia bacterium]